MERCAHIFLFMIVSLFFLISFVAKAQVHVNGYTRKDGTYVAPHMRSSPNSIKQDNWSTKGNINPYTGKIGTKISPDSSLSSSLSRSGSVASSGVSNNTQNKAFEIKRSK